MARLGNYVRLASKPSPDVVELLRAARRLVVALGYDGLSDHQGAAVLLAHAEVIREHRSCGTGVGLLPQEPEPASVVSSAKAEGELPIGPEDVRALLADQGLTICLAGELEK